MVLLSINEKQLFQVINDWNLKKTSCPKEKIVLKRNWNGYITNLPFDNKLQFKFIGVLEIIFYSCSVVVVVCVFVYVCVCAKN